MSSWMCTKLTKFTNFGYVFTWCSSILTLLKVSKKMKPVSPYVLDHK